MKKNELNKITRNQKIVGILTIFLFLGVIGFQMIKGSFATADENYLKSQTVENLEFGEAVLDYENGLSTYTVEVKNTLDDDYTLKTINIIFKDSEGKEIENLLGYIGDTLKGKEVKILEASVDKEITNISSIEYVINK